MFLSVVFKLSLTPAGYPTDMALRVECQKCQAVFAAKDGDAGKSGKCPTCKAPITVPAVADASVRKGVARAPSPPNKVAAAAVRPTARDTGNVAAESSPNQNEKSVPLPPAQQRAALLRELLAEFHGNIARVKVPISYRIGIVLSSLVMILLPLAYAGIVGLTGFAVYFHATHDTSMLEMGTGRGRLVMCTLYVGPIVAGAVLVLFMLKPLFARPLLEGRTRSLSRQGEPVLFAVVDRVCQAVGARTPGRINVDWQLNASAGLAEGFFRLFSNRLVLTIGAPLVAGLNVDEFVGVLAHEFGHFTQGAGRRMSFFVRWTSLWFLRVVYQRDTWDQWLDDSANELDLRIGWILHLARLGVWVSRRVLWVLMMIGHVVSSFLLRQMEFHADAHEARMVGGEVFEHTTRKLAVLGAIYQTSFHDLRVFAKRGRLPDDLSLLVLAKRSVIPPALLDRIERQVSEKKAGWLDTHPADRDRIARASREGTNPLFADPRPAAALFSDFKALSRNTTWDLYRANFGSRFQPSQMRPVEEVLRAEMPTAPAQEKPITLD